MIVAAVAAAGCSVPTEAQQTSSPVDVAFYGPRDDIVDERLFLDSHLRRVDSLDSAQAVVIHDAGLNAAPLETIRTRVEAGTLGLTLVLGPNSDAARVSTLLGMPVALEEVAPPADEPEKAEENQDGGEFQPTTTDELGGRTVAYTGPETHPLAEEISWKSSAQVYYLSRLGIAGDARARVTALVSTTAADGQTDTDAPADPVVAQIRVGDGAAYVLTAWIKRGNDEERLEYPWMVLKPVEGAHNHDFYNWSYFNWMLQFCVRDSAGAAWLSFDDWPWSPIPHRQQIVLLIGFIILGNISILTTFIVIRRYSRAHPEALHHIRVHAPAGEKKTFGEIGETESERKGAEGLFGPGAGVSRWEKIGFQRPLAGFQLVNCISILVFLIALAIFMVYTTNIMPFPQSAGISMWVSFVFRLAFTFLDLGTGVAMVKYFSEYRVKDPGRAMTYVQFYVWFQFLSGIFQISVIALLAAYLAPGTEYAFLTWFFVLHTLVQVPGFVSVFRNIFRALQRYHMMVLLDILPVPLILVTGVSAMLLMRRWGMQNPMYGEVLGATFGSSIAAFLNQWLILAIALIMYRKIGFSIKAPLMAHFTWDTVRTALRYGLKYTPGAMAPFLSLFAQPIVMSYWLNNYLELNSLLTVVLGASVAMQMTGSGLFHNLLPSVSEAYAHGRKILTRFYIDQGLKWSLLFTGSVVAFYLAVADKVILALTPPQWGRAAEYISLGLIFGIFDFLAKLPEETFQGAGYPQLYTYTNVGEHVLRVSFMILLVPQYGVRGVLYAYIISSILKSIAAWWILSRYVIRPEISWWQTVCVPGIIAVSMYLFATVIADAYWTGAPERAFQIVALFVVMSSMFYFLAGLLGGFDDNTLGEFHEALQMTRLTRTVGQIFYRPAAWGVAMSPLHNRLPLRNWDAAQAEAASLTAEKVEL